MKQLLLTITMFSCAFTFAQHGLDKEIATIEGKVIEWRRDFH